MNHRLLLPSVLILSALGLAACGDDTTTQPNEPVQPTATTPELAVTRGAWSVLASVTDTERERIVAAFTNGQQVSQLYLLAGYHWEEEFDSPAWAAFARRWRADLGWRRGANRFSCGFHPNGAAQLGAYVYRVGGAAPAFDGYYPCAFAYRYQPGTNTWYAIAEMPYEVTRGVTAGVAGRLYVYGRAYLQEGSEYAGEKLLRYNPKTNQWVALARPPFSLFDGYTRVANGGGGDIGGMWYLLAGCSGDKLYTRLWRYAPSSGAWTALAPMVSCRREAAVAAVGGKLFVAGGWVEARAKYVKSAKVYDPATNTWAALPDLPVTTPAEGVTIVRDGKPTFVVASQQGTRWVFYAYTP